MERIELRDNFGLHNLARAPVTRRALAPHEIRVSMRALSINYRDLLMIEGQYNPRQPLPLVPLSDGVGLVEEIGEQVTRFQIGDRVCGLFSQSWEDGPVTRKDLGQTLGGPLQGLWQQECILPESGAITPPAYLSDEEAATLPCAGLTAWSALKEHGTLKPKEYVVCLGTGGVSLFATQIARASGAEVILLTGSEEKAEKAIAVGANHTINYRQDERWDKTIREITQGQGADRVIEVGGAGTFDRSVKCLRPNGHLSLIGVLAKPGRAPNLTAVLMNQIRVQGIFVGHKTAFTRMNAFLTAQQIHPVIDSVLDAFSPTAPLERMQKALHFGKICLTFS
jgi:NADPH:quinone reductase-like Zn-dependent oxidoreductase